jgi:hypothetical protein
MGRFSLYKRKLPELGWVAYFHSVIKYGILFFFGGGGVTLPIMGRFSLSKRKLSEL